MMAAHFKLAIAVLFLSVTLYGITLGKISSSNKKIAGHLKVVKTSDKAKISNVGDEVCAQICSWWSCTTYYCPDGVCCTPGSPESLCCAEDHPVCLEGGCCISGSTHVCGDKCCTSDDSCCTEVDNCCETDEACCNSEECCDKESPCCRNDGENSGECCNEETMVCCGDGLGCTTPCRSQFEVVPCINTAPAANMKVTSREESKNVRVNDGDCPSLGDTGKLYRATYSGDNCQGGLIAKDPSAEKTVSSHVGCGSKPGYKSQYISFSTSYDVVYEKYWPMAQPGARLVEVDIDSHVVPKGCTIIDLTDPAVRKKYLIDGTSTGKPNIWAINYSTADCEVLLECGTSRVRCKTILGPKTDKDAAQADGGKTEL